MIVYTLQIGHGINNKMIRLEHSEIVSAPNLLGGITQAKTVINAGTWARDSNFVQLLEELDGDSRVVWFRPIEAIKGL